MDEILLSIAIPTYNRSTFLYRNLQSLLLQKDQLTNVEIIVSDNASTDDTEEVVTHFNSLGLNIKYLRNTENKGPDYNIAQCYRIAQGKYVVALGDDDIFIEGSITLLMPLLEREAGVIYLNSCDYEKNKELQLDALDYLEYVDAIEFIKKVNFYVTFISGNIINRKYLNTLDLIKFQGTSLVQVAFILEAIHKSTRNIYINNKLIASQHDNSGGYNLFKIFGTNFNFILNELKWDKNEAEVVKKIINNNLLSGFFPQFMLKLKLNSKHNFVKADPMIDLKPLFKNYINFWLCFYPIYILPVNLAKLYINFIKVFIKMRIV